MLCRKPFEAVDNLIAFRLSWQVGRRLMLWLFFMFFLVGCVTFPKTLPAPTLDPSVVGTGSVATIRPHALITPAATVEMTNEVKEPPEYANIAAGAAHTCMVTSQGKVQCWGANQFGQLGAEDSQLTPLEYAPVVDGVNPENWALAGVRALDGRVTAIAAGYYHTCVLTESGGVWCWGRNNGGQLGDGTNTDRNGPVEVRGLDGGVVGLAAGADHTCALLEPGGMRCWGENGSGQLGDGTTHSSSTPVEVQGLPEGIVQIAAGTVFTCAFTNDHQIFCWGDGQMGRFGDGSTGFYPSPVVLEGLGDGVAAIVAGDYHLCALTRPGEVACWGALSSEQEFTSRKPFVVSGLSDEVVRLTAGGGHTCVLTTADGVKCWGDNYFGQLGNGGDLGSWEPVDAMGLTSGVLRVASGSGHVCALLIVGGVKCWGDCSNGQCGDSTLKWAWSTYTNRDYHFSLDYPPGWNVLEVANSTDPTEMGRVWLGLPGFSLTQTGARPEIVLIITENEPSQNWGSQFFENYKHETIQLGNVEAVRISGTNKESLGDEIVIIIQAGGYFIQAMPNQSPEAMKYFEQVMRSLTIEV
jgi:alpha-tubulin suppressor-like RCC1 family protein